MSKVHAFLAQPSSTCLRRQSLDATPHRSGPWWAVRQPLTCLAQKPSLYGLVASHRRGISGLRLMSIGYLHAHARTHNSSRSHVTECKSVADLSRYSLLAQTKTCRVLLKHISNQTVVGNANVVLIPSVSNQPAPMRLNHHLDGYAQLPSQHSVAPSSHLITYPTKLKEEIIHSLNSTVVTVTFIGHTKSKRFRPLPPSLPRQSPHLLKKSRVSFFVFFFFLSSFVACILSPLLLFPMFIIAS